MEKEEKLKSTIASNLTYYRKQAGLTQLKLAEILNYSDKAVSKWERGEGVPDIFILVQLADFYQISVNDLIGERKIIKKASFLKNRILITLLSIVLAWLVFVVSFAIVTIIERNTSNDWSKWTWVLFIAPIPVSCIIALVFDKIWDEVRWHRFFIVSGIVWTTALLIVSLLLVFDVNFHWVIWFVAATLQILVVLWYGLIRKGK